MELNNRITDHGKLHSRLVLFVLHMRNISNGKLLRIGFTLLNDFSFKNVMDE